MKHRKLLSQMAALVFSLAMLIFSFPITAEAAEAKPLSQHPTGTVFKLSEDGTLYDWILISHNYEGTGNQLLMRKDCIYYATGFVYGRYYDDGENITLTCTPKFSSSPFKAYLNSEYITKFNSLVSEKFQEVTIKTYGTGSKNIIEDSMKIFILSENEIFGTVSIYSDYNYCTNSATGTFIDYFSSAEKRASNQRYMVRDGECSGIYSHSSHPQYGGTTISITGTRAAGYNNMDLLSPRKSGWYSPTNYYRPCLVLPADTIAIAGEEIKGEIIPEIESVEVSDEWAAANSVEINAVNAESYAVTTENVEPVDGWQRSNRFKLTENGRYRAWAKSATENVVSAEFAVSRVDSLPPVISDVSVPSGWTIGKTVTISASDNESGINGYLTTSTDAIPAAGAAWQTSPDFTFTKSGSYYAWAKDNAGNISYSFAFEIDQIDTDKPVISELIYPAEWTNNAVLTITAADKTSSLLYALSGNSALPTDGWQSEPAFSLTANGSFYAWAKDEAGNSVSKFFYFSKYDATPPEIGSITFNTANTVMTVSASDSTSGVECVIIDSAEYSGGYTQYKIPLGTRYLTIQAKDKAGNLSAEKRIRVPGWYDTLSTLTVTSVEFDNEVTTAAITAESTAAQIQGIYVNDVLFEANPVIYPLTDNTKYLIMQVVDVNGDRSALYKVRVPNWTEEISSLEIVGCVFSEDNSCATVTAVENVEKESDRRGITGIKINGEFFEGNPVIYPIPEGTRHLEMKAYNTDGDYSPTLIRRVPGWSEVVSTLSIVNCEFSNYNKRATVTALATGGDSVAGIFVNGEFFEGNPVVYDIDKNTDVLHLQAANFNGDLSAMVNRDVPRDSSKSTLKLTITAPGWTNADRAKVKITATDKASIHEILAKTGDDEDWEDITDKLYIYITEDTTVWASVENDEGTVKETHLDITCFDRKAPTVSAAQQDKVVNIRAEDDKSGVKAIYVNNVEYSGSKIYGGNLRYTIPDEVTTVKIKAVDEAGNESEMVELAVRATITAIPVTIAPTQPPIISPEPEPPIAAIPEPQPTAKAEPEEDAPVVEPEPETVIEDKPKAAGLTTEQLISLALGAFALSCTGTGGFIWWLMRKRRQNSIVPELDFNNCKLKYDESDYHGSVDPLDENVTEVAFNKKVS